MAYGDNDYIQGDRRLDQSLKRRVHQVNTATVRMESDESQNDYKVSILYDGENDRKMSKEEKRVCKQN